MTIINHAQDFLKITSTWFNNETNSDLQIRLKKRVLKSSDKRLKNKDKVLHCHRLVLSSWSEVWAAALQDEKESCLDLLSHDAAIVEMCVKYCYTSTIDLTEENVTKVHLFAHQYNLKALEAACEQMITRAVNEELSATNCLGLYCYLLEHEFPNLPNAVQSIQEFVCQEFAAASKSNGFLGLPLELLCRLLKEDDLNCHEDDVLDACCRWLEASPVGSNPQVRERVLQLVRFPMLSAQKLLEFKSHPMMPDSMAPRFVFALQWVVTSLIPTPGQQPLRIKLTEENKTEILTPRFPFTLQIKSQILDGEMMRTLSSMLGGKQRRVARLLVDSSSGTKADVFNKAVRGQGPFICIIKSDKGHVFGAYVEDTFKSEGDFISGSPNNFLFSLKAIPPQQVVKLKRTGLGKGVDVGGCGLHLGYYAFRASALVAFCSHSTADSPCFELAPGYESVGSTTLHGEFGTYTPSFMEVFALPLAPSRHSHT